MRPLRTWVRVPADPPSDEPLPPPSDDPLPPPQEPSPAPEPAPESEGGSGPDESEPASEPEISDDPLPPPEDEREDEPRGGRQDPTELPEAPVELETDDKVFDCGLTDGGCHVSNWFADFVVSGLNPALEWLAERAFWTPMPTEGMKALHTGILTTSNILYLLLIVAGAVIAMGYQTIQMRYSATDLLPRLVAGFAASNLSMWISTEIIRLSNDMSTAIGARGIDAREAAENLRDRMDVILLEAVLFTVLLLVVIVVLLVVWMISEAVRICVVIVLVIGAPLLLMFHALPHTNRLAELWWKSLVGACAIPIAQAVAFLAMMQLFFEGQMSLMGNTSAAATAGPGRGQVVLDTGSEHTVALASSIIASPETGSASGDGWLMNIMLLLVLLYVQIRIGSWVSRLVWQPNPGTSPIAALLKNIAWMMAFRSLGSLRLPKAFDFGLRRPQFAWPQRRPGKPLPRYHPKPGSGLQPLQPQAWWYRHRHDPPDPAGDLTRGGRRALPGPGANGHWHRPGPGPDPGGPAPALPGQKALPPVPPPRPAPPTPARRALEEGRMPGSPKTGQQTLFARPSPPGAKPQGGAGPPQRRWRQGVLPTPPPVRVSSRKGTERLGWLPALSRPSAGLRLLPDMPRLEWSKPTHVKGQGALFRSPRRVWKQYGLFPQPRWSKK